ncbi:MAG: DUF3592 domain-containing protein [Bacilli bacterium]|nr:DUF3592 domain-containing protein [Bacilli bacterium]
MSSVIAKREKTRRMPTLALFFIIIGTVLLVISFKDLSTFYHKNNSYISTEAHVIKHTYDNGKISSVILEYTVGENKYTVYSNNKTDYIKSYGSIINVKYNPKNPEDVVFPNRGFNIVIPVASLVLLSIGLAIVIVMLSDNVKRLRKYSKIITDKKKEDRDNTNPYNRFNNNVQTNNMIYDNKENAINEEEIKEIIEPKEKRTVAEKDRVKEDKEEEIIEIPSVSDDSNPFDNVNYIDFISNLDNNDEVPNFIPNIDKLKEKEQSK